MIECENDADRKKGFDRNKKMRRERESVFSYLQVPDGSIEWIIAEAAFLVQEFPGFSIYRRTEEAVIEALLQLLQGMKF